MSAPYNLQQIIYSQTYLKGHFYIANHSLLKGSLISPINEQCIIFYYKGHLLIKGTLSGSFECPLYTGQTVHDSNHAMKFINLHKDVLKQETWRKNKAKRHGTYQLKEEMFTKKEIREGGGGVETCMINQIYCYLLERLVLILCVILYNIRVRSRCWCLYIIRTRLFNVVFEQVFNTLLL